MPKLERRLRSQFQTRHDWHSCRVYRSTNQSIPTGVWTAISFDTVRWDTSPEVTRKIWMVANPTRLTCRRAGPAYQISGTIEWDLNATGERAVGIRLNGATYLARELEMATVGNYANEMAISTLYELAVGDFVELMVFQTRGVALNIVSSGNYSPEFMMARVG